MSDRIRATYLAAAAVAVDMIGDERVGARWDRPSALEAMTVGALAAHLARSLVTVDAYLDTPVEGGPTVDAVAYYAGLEGLRDHDSEVNRGVRARSDEGAAPGWAETGRAIRTRLETLTGRLAAEPADRLVVVYGGLRMLLDDYLATRCVEIAVHGDDLAESVGLDVEVPPEAARVAIEVLVAVAVETHGATRVLRGLARRERDTVEALRVF